MLILIMTTAHAFERRSVKRRWERTVYGCSWTSRCHVVHERRFRLNILYTRLLHPLYLIGGRSGCELAAGNPMWAIYSYEQLLSNGCVQINYISRLRTFFIHEYKNVFHHILVQRFLAIFFRVIFASSFAKNQKAMIWLIHDDGEI